MGSVPSQITKEGRSLDRPGDLEIAAPCFIIRDDTAVVPPKITPRASAPASARDPLAKNFGVALQLEGRAPSRPK
jgi:hypothetical protein